MPGETDDQQELPQRFEHPVNKANTALLKFAGVILLVATIATFFALPMFFIDIGKLGSFTIVIPIFFSVMLLTRAGQARSIADVTIDESGLIIERGGKAKEIAWTDLRWAEQNQAWGSQYLFLYGRDMAIVDRIPKTIDRFETLCKLVSARFDQRPLEEVADALGERVGKYKRGQLVFGSTLTVLGLILIFFAQIMPNEIPRLNKHGEFGWAEIIELYKTGEKQLPKLTYQVSVDDQFGPVEDVLMEDEAWQLLKEGFDNEGNRYVEVVYLPDELEVSFANGQVMPGTNYTPTFIYLKAGFSLLIGLWTLSSALRHRNVRELAAKEIQDQRSKTAG